jgi:hypothetical protein
MPHQQMIADVTGELLPDGRMAYPFVIVIMPRRGGKTVLVLATGIQRCAAIKRGRVWYTAQTGKDAGDTFREEWLPLVKASRLDRSIRSRMSNGSESFGVGVHGSRLGVFAPTEKALHGKDADVVTIDEAWAFDEFKGGQVEAAVRPTMLTRRKRQLWVPSAGGTSRSTWLLRLRDMGRSLPQLDQLDDGRVILAPDQGIAYFEWHPPVIERDHKLIVDPSIDLDDPAVWADTHPAIGQTINLEALGQDRQTYGAATFHRTILNVFQTGSGDRIIDEHQWAAAQDSELQLPDDGLSLAYDVDEDRSAGAIAVGRKLPDGRIGVELVGLGPGVGWIAPEVIAKRARRPFSIAADSYSPASTVTRELRRAGIDVDELDVGRYADAAAELLDDLKAGKLVVRADDALDLAAGLVEWRKLGDRRAFSRSSSSGSVAAVVAVTIAAHHARHKVAARPVIELGVSA